MEADSTHIAVAVAAAVIAGGRRVGRNAGDILLSIDTGVGRGAYQLAMARHGRNVTLVVIETVRAGGLHVALRRRGVTQTVTHGEQEVILHAILGLWAERKHTLRGILSHVKVTDHHICL